MPNEMPNLRIGDAEREDAAQLLQDHLAAGRLDADEFDLRIARALQATHRSELDGLFTDLPGRRPGQILPVRAAAPPPARFGRAPWLWPVGAAAATLWFGVLGLRTVAHAGMEMGGPHQLPDPMMTGLPHGPSAFIVLIPLLLFTLTVIAATVHAHRLRRRRA